MPLPTRSAGIPFACEHSQDHLIGEIAVNPRRAAKPAFLPEPCPRSGLYYRRVVGEQPRLQPVQAANGEAIAAEHAGHVAGPVG